MTNSRMAAAKATNLSANPPALTRPTGEWTIRPSLLRLTVLNLTFWLWAIIAGAVSAAGMFAYIWLEWAQVLILPILAIAAVFLWVVVRRTITITVVLSEKEDTVTVERLFSSAILPEKATFQLEKLVSGDGLKIDVTSTLDNWLSRFRPTRRLAVGTLTFSRAGAGGGLTVEGLADPRGLESWLRAANTAIENYDKAKREAEEKEKAAKEKAVLTESLAQALRKVATELGFNPKASDENPAS